MKVIKHFSMLSKLYMQLPAFSKVASFGVACVFACTFSTSSFANQLSISHELSSFIGKDTRNSSLVRDLQVLNNRTYLKGVYADPINVSLGGTLDILSLECDYLKKGMEKGLAKQIDAVLNNEYIYNISIPKYNFTEAISKPLRVRTHELNHMGYMIDNAHVMNDSDSFDAIIINDDYFCSSIHKKIAELECVLTESLNDNYHYSQSLESTGLAYNNIKKTSNVDAKGYDSVFIVHNDHNSDTYKYLETSLGFNKEKPEDIARTLFIHQDYLVQSIESSLADNNLLSQQIPFYKKTSNTVNEKVSEVAKKEEFNVPICLPQHLINNYCTKKDWKVLTNINYFNILPEFDQASLLAKCSLALSKAGLLQHYKPYYNHLHKNYFANDLVVKQQTFAEREGNIVSISLDYLYHVKSVQEGTFIQGTQDTNNNIQGIDTLHAYEGNKSDYKSVFDEINQERKALNTLGRYFHIDIE